MNIKIDNTADRPVYQQIIDQIKRQIALGEILAGDKLPTVRQLAKEIVINPNTIAKAYRQLETEKVINTKPGVGTYVSEFENSVHDDVKAKIITDALERVAVDAVHMRVNRKTMQAWFDIVMNQFDLE